MAKQAETRKEKLCAIEGHNKQKEGCNTHPSRDKIKTKTIEFRQNLLYYKSR